MPKAQAGKGSADSISVFIADSSQLNCQLVERAFRPKRNHVNVVATAARGDQALSLLREHQPEIAVISAQLEDSALGGYRVLRELRTIAARTKGVMLLNSRDHELVVGAFRCGARGVVFRDEPVEILCKCIHAVHHGQVWANSETLRHLIEALSRTMPLRLRDGRRMDLLSKREGDVTRLIAEGLNNKDISVELALSEHTVRNYIFHIYEKLGVSTRVELVLYWLQQQSNNASTPFEDQPKRPPNADLNRLV